MEIDHEIISTVILLPSAESFKKGFCQLLLVQACPGKSVVRLTDHPAMTIAVAWDVKQQNKQTNKKGPLSKDRKLVFKTNHRLMQVKSI